MSQITELELQNLRHLIMNSDNTYAKMSDYAKNTTDPMFKEYFEKSAQNSKEIRKQLMDFLK